MGILLACAVAVLFVLVDIAVMLVVLGLPELLDREGGPAYLLDRERRGGHVPQLRQAEPPPGRP
jgi:hypothetical protein